MTFNHFIKGVKNFYGATSKREQIIKGQVAPSLSKVIKIGITLKQSLNLISVKIFSGFKLIFVVVVYKFSHAFF